MVMSNVFFVVMVVGFALSAVMLAVVILLFVRDDLPQAVRDVRQMPPGIRGRAREAVPRDCFGRVSTSVPETGELTSDDLLDDHTGEERGDSLPHVTEELDGDETVMLSEEELDDGSEQTALPTTLMLQALLDAIPLEVRSASETLEPSKTTSTSPKWDHFVSVENVIVTHQHQGSSSESAPLPRS